MLEPPRALGRPPRRRRSLDPTIGARCVPARVRRARRFDVAFRLQENRWNGTVAPQLVVRRVFDADERYAELVAWLREQWCAEQRDAAAQEIFDELELGAGARRSLLESHRFRALLDEP